MPKKSNKPFLMRYYEIDDILKGGKKVTLKEIHRKLGGDDVITERMVQNDIDAIKSLWVGKIIKNKDNKLFYEDNTFSIKSFPITANEIVLIELATHTLQNLFSTPLIKRYNSAISKILKGYDTTSDKIDEDLKQELISNQIIQPEISYSKIGYKWIEPIFDSILNRSSIEIIYQKAGKDSETKIISPYLLKAFRNHWYLIGFDHSKKEHARIYALERINDIKISKQSYYEDLAFNSEAYFKYIFGIFQDDNKPPIELKLEFYNTAIQQVINHPLMPTQTHKLSDDKKVLKVELTVFNSGELIKALLSYGSSVKVISPTEVSDIIKKHLQKAMNYY